MIIERFKNIINDTKPIIVLCRYNTCHVLKLQKLFMEYYKIININTEKNNIWNESSIWKECIDKIILKINKNQL